MERPRVLHIDHDRDCQALVQKVLAKHCDLIFLEDPFQSFDAAEIFEPDLVIAELDLPCLDGFEVISLFQEDSHLKNIPVMIFSSRRDVESQKLAYRLGAMHFQAKPCRPSQLFKGAAMFARLASGERPPKTHPIDKVLYRLDERASAHRLHPILAQAVGTRIRKHPLRTNTGTPDSQILAAVGGREPELVHSVKGRHT